MLRLRERISDEEVIDNSKFFDDASQQVNMTPQLSEILQRYGNLLYFIQRDSRYLTELLNSIPSAELDQLIQVRVCFSPCLCVCVCVCVFTGWKEKKWG